MESLVISRVFVSITLFGAIEFFYTTKWCCIQDWSYSNTCREPKNVIFLDVQAMNALPTDNIPSCNFIYLSRDVNGLDTYFTDTADRSWIFDSLPTVLLTVCQRFKHLLESVGTYILSILPVDQTGYQLKLL